MPYHFCSWYDTHGIFAVPHFGFGHSIFVLRCLVIRLQWQQNVISDISDRVLLYRMWRRIQDCTMCTTSEGKGKRSIAVRNTLHRYGNSHAIWDHTVFPATRQRWHEHAVEATKKPEASDSCQDLVLGEHKHCLQSCIGLYTVNQQKRFINRQSVQLRKCRGRV